MRVKLTLTPEEIRQYNSYKEKIRKARTRTEISAYRRKAEEILKLGRIRYIQGLEKKVSSNNSNISTVSAVNNK